MVDSAVSPPCRGRRTTFGEARRSIASVTCHFLCIRNAVRELLGKQADALARKFHETRDMALKDELERLLTEYGKLEEQWKFSP